MRTVLAVANKLSRTWRTCSVTLFDFSPDVHYSSQLKLLEMWNMLFFSLKNIKNLFSLLAASLAVRKCSISISSVNSLFLSFETCHRMQINTNTMYTCHGGLFIIICFQFLSVRPRVRVKERRFVCLLIFLLLLVRKFHNPITEFDIQNKNGTQNP